MQEQALCRGIGNDPQGAGSRTGRGLFLRESGSSIKACRKQSRGFSIGSMVAQCHLKESQLRRPLGARCVSRDSNRLCLMFTRSWNPPIWIKASSNRCCIQRKKWARAGSHRASLQSLASRQFQWMITWDNYGIIVGNLIRALLGRYICGQLLGT